jgi:hypothetical protein
MAKRRATGKVRLSMMVGDYEIVRALKDGTVKPKGIDLVVAKYPGTGHPTGGCWPALPTSNEFNAGAYVVQKHKGRGDFPRAGVPARRFRHGFIYVNKSKGIASPPPHRPARRLPHAWRRGRLLDAGIEERPCRAHRSILGDRGERRRFAAAPRT